MKNRNHNLTKYITDNAWQHKVLTIDQQDEWRSLVEAIHHRDIFFRPEYMLLFERLSGGVARLFFFGNEASYIIYPFFIRRINDLPFYRALPFDNKTEYFDVVSPYGYSGPLARVSDQSRQRDLWKEYLTAFRRYCQEMNIVCDFARLNPFVGNQKYLQELTESVQANNEITYLDLSKSDEALWQGLNRGNRSNINKARRAGVEIHRDENGEYLPSFYRLYLATMRRNRAVDWYNFSLDFFADSFTLLGDKITLFYASYNEQIIAAASFLHDGEVVHYFLSGSERNYLTLRPNNLLMYQAICWAKHQGYRLFNLGGGYGSNGSLARFKAAFSKLSTTFYTYRTVHNPSIYDELCRRHAIYYQLNANRPQGENTDYFPLYRANGSV